jgi:Predicted periplasmic protein (DUF2271)
MSMKKANPVTQSRQRMAIYVLCIAFAPSCNPAHGSDPTFWEPYHGDANVSESTVSSATAGGSASGSGGNGGNGGNGGAGGGVVVGKRELIFQFTTVSRNGKYAPKNVGAVWITDNSGSFVKTLELWAAKRSEHLVKWNSVTGANIVDAVTGATRGSHGAHEVTWDGTNVSGGQVADGEYSVNVEFTEWNSSDGGMMAGPFLSVSFPLGLVKQDFTPQDVTGFSSMHLVYEP